jgi:hypothetical protein
MKFTRILVAALVLAISSSVQGRLLESYDVAGWSVFAYTDDTSGAFTHCAVGSTYRSGVMLMFVINKDKEWSMALSSSNWDLTVGNKYTFDVRLDDARGENWFGFATTSKLISVPLAHQSGLFDKFRRSRVLTINAVSGRFDFLLTNSSEALRSLVRCTLKYMQPGSIITNPFEAQAPRSVVSQPNDGLYAEAAVTITNMLAEIGTTGHRLLPIDKVKSEFQGQHAVWSTQNAIGALQIYTTPSSIEDVTAALIAKAAADCKGKFATGKNVSSGNTQKIEVACEQEDGKLLTYFYIVLHRPAGGKYIFTVFNGGDNPSSHSEAARVSDMILASQKK